MLSIDELLSALPIRDITVRAGSYGNCGGVLLLNVDLEPGRAEGVEVVDDDAELPDWFEDFPDDAVECMDRIGYGARTGFRDHFGVEPAVRIVVRSARYNPVDIIMAIGPRAGQLIVTEAIGRATLVAGLVPSEPIDPAPSRAGSRQQRLRVPIGLTYQGTPLALDLKEAVDQGMGPHGMFLGAAGTGRLDAVHGIVSGLARSHSPEELNLELLDAADEAGFERFDRLPHTRQRYRDLAAQPSRLSRWVYENFTEMDDRRKLLDQTGFATHAAYERARAEGQDLAPLPSLLIVIDGFDRLLSAATTTDFMATLVQIGRDGRKRGIHMLLTANGLGEGVLRGLDCFLSYRIATRVSTVVESRVVVGVNDAYDLPGEPGHAYLKVGTEKLIRFQFTAAIDRQEAVSTPPLRPPGG